MIFGGYRHTVETPRSHYPEAEYWGQSTSIRNWQWSLYDWSRWFDVHAVGPQSHYPGIRVQRPDVLNWYYQQGRERPIYLCDTHPAVMGSVAYPLAAVKAAIPESAGRFGCQLDYMAALAEMEGFDRWILYGVGQPYVDEPHGRRAARWFEKHQSFLWWLHRARARGVEVVYDGPNMFHPDVRGEAPPPEPYTGDYGYDMQTDFEHFTQVQAEGYPFGRE